MIDRRAFTAAATAASVMTGGAQAQSVATDAQGRPLSHPLVGRAAPSFTATTTTGGTVSNATLAGKWSVLDFWGIWCPDCIVDAPHVEALARAIAQDPGLSFYSVHVDKRTGRWDSVASYMREKGLTYPVLLDPDKALYRAFELQWVPTYLVLDPRGVVRGFRTDLSMETSGQGGVKTFIQDIARLRAAHRA